MPASGTGPATTSASGWDTRLYWQWIGYNTIAFVTVLTAGFVLALLGSDALHLDLASGHVLVALLIATSGPSCSGVFWEPCNGWSSAGGYPCPARCGSPPTSARRCWPGSS
uniref:Uncharacterized protein n=1 Tax=Streptomyces sp. NBC_01393 TaxID=2903851 RepID=A0AAU3HWH8_9ACTN